MARRMLAPINTIKHFVQQPNTALATATIRNQILVEAVAVGNAFANTFDVIEGAVIKAIHMDFWILNEGASGTTTQWNAILEKVVAGGTGATLTNILNLQAYDNKKNVLHTFQGNVQAAVDGGGSTPYIQGWFKIPKGKQRFGAGDSLVLSLLSNGQAAAICGVAIYKEYQ